MSTLKRFAWSGPASWLRVKPIENTTLRGSVALAATLAVAVVVVSAVYDNQPGRPSESGSTQTALGSRVETAVPTMEPTIGATGTSSVQPAADYLLMPGSEFLALPTTGPAWDFVVATAQSAWPEPNFRDQDNKTGTLALAAALVYARTGDAGMRTKARDAIMAVIPTFDPSSPGEGLGPLRQTAGWVLAADFAHLEGEDEARFRAFLDRVLTERTGSHSRWNSVDGTHDDSSNNWGAWAGAARIAARLYLDESVDDAVATFRGFLGDRDSWSEFLGQTEPIAPAVEDWACDASLARFQPVNGSCRREGIDLDGAIPADISRGSEALHWPPAPNGIMYTHETIAGYMLQAELLYRNGYPEIWRTENEALRRMADVISRSEAAGGPPWNPGPVQYHIPWLLNARYGTNYPTVPAEYGRTFGFTDWLYGS